MAVRITLFLLIGLGLAGIAVAVLHWPRIAGRGADCTDRRGAAAAAPKTPILAAHE